MSDVTRPVLADPESGDDLATKRPGQQLRQKSAQLRQAHPVLTIFGRVFNIHNNERAWSKGADAEEEVARRLRKLGESWRVLHGELARAHDTSSKGHFCGFTVALFKDRKKLAKTQHRVTVFQNWPERLGTGTVIAGPRSPQVPG